MILGDDEEKVWLLVEIPHSCNVVRFFCIHSLPIVELITHAKQVWQRVQKLLTIRGRGGGKPEICKENDMIMLVLVQASDLYTYSDARAS